MRVVRIYHAGRDSAHRERDRALVRAGADLTLIVPSRWPGPDELQDEPFEIVQMPVVRVGDVNRHRFLDPEAVLQRVTKLAPDILDLHEEPFQPRQCTNCSVRAPSEQEGRLLHRAEHR